MTSTLREAVRLMFKLMVDVLGELGKQIAVLDREIARRAKGAFTPSFQCPPVSARANAHFGRAPCALARTSIC